MKALVFHGTNDVRIDDVPEPKITKQDDIIVKITSTAICGSDLHLVDGYVPTVEKGDILGHEFMGEVVEKGSEITNLNISDRVVVPFPIACGVCFFCKQTMYSLCDNSNPNKQMAEKLMGHSPAGIFGYSHIFGGFAGGQAEFARVPYGNIGPLKIENGINDEQVLFLSDILPTGYMAAENCNIQSGQVVAVWGCGPVGLFSILSAYLLGAERVIAIDRFPYRLEMAGKFCRAETINYAEIESVVEILKDMTNGRGPDACIDAVGMEAHGTGLAGAYDKVKQAIISETDRPTALREVIQSCRKGGIVSVPGVYGGMVDKFPIGVAFNKGLTIKAGQTHVHRYMRPLLQLIRDGKIDPAFLITHRLPLSEAPHGYDIFKNKEDECVKVVMHT